MRAHAGSRPGGPTLSMGCTVAAFGSPMKWRILGPVEVAAGGTALPVERPQQRAVLAYLLLNANRVVSTTQLVEAMWGAAPPASARAQIQACVSQIRRALRGA